MTLPTGWVETTLGDIADFVMGQAPPGSECNVSGKGTPFVKAGEFGSSRPVIREWTTQPLKLARHDDVLICVVGATAGKLNLGADCAIGRSVAAIRPSEATTASFIYPRLKSEVSRLRSGSTGTAQGVISREMLGDVAISLPPLAEQRQIVAKLDALSASLSRARTELDRAAVLAKMLRHRAVEVAFGDVDHPIVGWRSLKLRDLLTAGPSNGWSPKSDASATGALTLKLTATTSGRLRLDDRAVKRIYEIPDEDSKYWLRDGDLLVQRANALEHVGASAIYHGPEKTYIYPDLMMRLRFDNPVLTKLVWYRLNSPTGRKYLQERATGTAGNMPKISGSVIRDFPIALPNEAEQKAIAQKLDMAYARADRLEAEAARARGLLDRLEAAILAKAFCGELVPQDPNDEPASVLLDRIRAERAAAPKPKRGRARKAVD